MMDEPAQNLEISAKGAILRLFGVVLVILGTLNTMLSWRGGLEIAPSSVLLIAGGLLLCLVGSIVRGDRA